MGALALFLLYIYDAFDLEGIRQRFRKVMAVVGVILMNIRITIRGCYTGFSECLPFKTVLVLAKKYKILNLQIKLGRRAPVTINTVVLWQLKI